jgi:DNA-binding response OmpR family regulator
MISSKLEFEVGFQRFPVVIEPGATVGRTIQALAQLPLEATLVGRHPLAPGEVANPEDVFSLAEGKLLYTPQMRECLMPQEDRGEELTVIENGLLFTLAVSEGILCTREALKNQVWNRPATDNTLHSHISNLRKKLGENISPYIRTLSGAGFILLKQL